MVWCSIGSPGITLSLVSVALRGQDLFYQLLLQLTLVLIFTCIQAYKQPFENNVLDLWCMMNNVAQYLLLLELIIMNITIFCVIGFHVYLCIKNRNWCRKKAVLQKNDDTIVAYESIPEITNSLIKLDPETNHSEIHALFQLRKPLIELLDK